MIKLTKPLIVFDLETTGINFLNDRIVELFMLKIEPDSKQSEYEQRFNPGIVIPDNVIAIHGITNEMVANEPAFSEKADELVKFIGNADFAGFNSNKFDLPMLMEEFYRCGIELDLEKRKVIDAQRIFHMMEPRTLKAAFKFYCDSELENAHSAKADTLATWEILKAQTKKYSELESTSESLAKFSGQEHLADLSGRIVRDKDGNLVFNFGKYKGQEVSKVFEKEPSYYDWMMKGDFAGQTKRMITKIRLEKMNQ